MTWLTQDSPGGVHVIPEDDLLYHTETESCSCVPVVTEIGYECCHGKMAVRRMFTHNAMDGRPD